MTEPAIKDCIAWLWEPIGDDVSYSSLNGEWRRHIADHLRRLQVVESMLADPGFVWMQREIAVLWAYKSGAAEAGHGAQELVKFVESVAREKWNAEREGK